MTAHPKGEQFLSILNNMKKLIVLEGMDKTGKDLYMQHAYDAELYHYYASKNPMKKKDTAWIFKKDYFIKNLKKLYDLEYKELRDLSVKCDKDILMCRYELSELVYTLMNSRKNILSNDPSFIDLTTNYYDVHNVILLFDEWTDYVRSLPRLACLEYDEPLFNKCQSYYKHYANPNKDVIVYLHSGMSLLERMKRIREAIVKIYEL